MHYRFLILSYIFILISSCSWISDKWNDRPSWVMPDNSLAGSNDIVYGDYSLLSGLNINDTAGATLPIPNESNILDMDGPDIEIYYLNNIVDEFDNVLDSKDSSSNIVRGIVASSLAHRKGIDVLIKAVNKIEIISIYGLLKYPMD